MINEKLNMDLSRIKYGMPVTWQNCSYSGMSNRAGFIKAAVSGPSLEEWMQNFLNDFTNNTHTIMNMQHHCSKQSCVCQLLECAPCHILTNCPVIS